MQKNNSFNDVQKALKLLDEADHNMQPFSSDGTAWQWLIDNTKLLPKQILDFADRIGCSELQVIEAVKQGSDSGRNEGDIIKDLLTEVRTADENRIEDYRKITAAQNLQAFADGIADSVNAPAISTGFIELDKALEGGIRKGLYLLGGIPSVGKTSLALQIADQVAAQGMDVLYISMEMERYELMAKSISRETAKLTMDEASDFGGINNAKTAIGIMDGTKYRHYSAKEIDLIYAAINQYEGFASNLYVLETDGNFSVMDVREAVEKHNRITGNLPIVIVDYIQILSPMNERATDKTNIDKAVRELKLISRDYKTPVIGISSFNRTNYNRPVALDSFKESGNIEYAGDVVIGLQYADVDKSSFDIEAAKAENARKVDLVILKNRNGKTGMKVPFDYCAKFNLFMIREDKSQEYEWIKK